MRPRRLVPALQRESCSRGRFTDGPVRDPHGHGSLAFAATAVTPRAAQRAAARRAASRDTRATPQAEGLVRARGHARFHTPVPAPWRVALVQGSLREGHRALRKRISDLVRSMNMREPGWLARVCSDRSAFKRPSDSRVYALESGPLPLMLTRSGSTDRAWVCVLAGGVGLLFGGLCIPIVELPP